MLKKHKIKFNRIQYIPCRIDEGEYSDLSRSEMETRLLRFGMNRSRATTGKIHEGRFPVFPDRIRN